MKYNEITKNYFFRFYKCGLSVEKTANLCFKSVIEVKKWDRGKTIPPECKRLMRLHTGKALGVGNNWHGFEVRKNKLLLPTGRELEPQQILTAVALLEIECDTDKRTLTKLMRLVRALSIIQKNNR